MLFGRRVRCVLERWARRFASIFDGCRRRVLLTETKEFFLWCGGFSIFIIHIGVDLFVWINVGWHLPSLDHILQIVGLRVQIDARNAASMMSGDHNGSFSSVLGNFTVVCLFVVESRSRASSFRWSAWARTNLTILRVMLSQLSDLLVTVSNLKRFVCLQPSLFC